MANTITKNAKSTDLFRALKGEPVADVIEIDDLGAQVTSEDQANG